MPFILCQEMKYARASGVTISGWQLLKVSGPRGEAMASVRVPAFVCFSLRSVSLIYPLILLFFNFLEVRFLFFLSFFSFRGYVPLKVVLGFWLVRVRWAGWSLRNCERKRLPRALDGKGGEG